ncbi:MAG: acylneuraminate cytidylyltransferase family protein, partial [Tabrizicola sp.]
MILGHIGARKGSKGVPRKNFRLIHGKPLIDWSL